MKTYNNLYCSLCSIENLRLAFKKARKGKTKKDYVIRFEADLDRELGILKHELETRTYSPRPLRRFVIRDPKSRVIHASSFRDRVVHHALCNIIEPIFEKIFIYDSYASRKGKGTHAALKRFDEFKHKIAQMTRSTGGGRRHPVKGYIMKADIKHFFETVHHETLINAIKKKVKDEKLIRLVRIVLSNYKAKEVGMPLGNLSSQFFANVFLNELDYFVKHKLKAKYYIRYVDDFIILHESERVLMLYKKEVNGFLNSLKLELHPEKSKIFPFNEGITFLGYRIFYSHKLLRKSNIRKFRRNFKAKLKLYDKGLISQEAFVSSLQGWFGYAIWANTYKLRCYILNEINSDLKDL